MLGIAFWLLMSMVQLSEVRAVDKTDTPLHDSSSPTVSCGVAAVFLLAKLTGREVDSTFLAKQAETGDQLLSLEDLKERCHRLGISARAYQVQSGENVEILRPVIAHIDTPLGGHFVVLRPTPNGLQWIDPSAPRLFWNPDHSNVIPELSKPFTGFFVAEEGALNIPHKWTIVDTLLIGGVLLVIVLLASRLQVHAKRFWGRLVRTAHRRSKTNQFLACCGMCLLLVTSGCGDPPATSKVAPGVAQEVLSAGLECLQFPEEIVVGSEPKPFVVRFRNRSSEPIRLEQVEKTGAFCNSIRWVKMEPEVIPPGKEFSVTYECAPNQASGEAKGMVSFRAIGSSEDRMFQKELRMLLQGARDQLIFPQVDFGEFSKKVLPITKSISISILTSEAFDEGRLQWELFVGGVEVLPRFDQRVERDYTLGVTMHVIPVDFRLVSIAQNDADFLFPVHATYGNATSRSNLTGTVMPEWSLGKRGEPKILATRSQCLPSEFEFYHHGLSVSELTSASVPDDAPILVSIAGRSRVRFESNPTFWKSSDAGRLENSVKLQLVIQGKDGDDEFRVPISLEVLLQ